MTHEVDPNRAVTGRGRGATLRTATPRADADRAVVSRTVGTTIGRLQLVADAERLLHVRFVAAGSPSDEGHRPASGSTKVLDRAADQLVEYFAGRRRTFQVPLDFDGVSGPFRRRVLEVLQREVGFGRTLTYGELAALAGRPSASRAVGSAMSHNPLPIFVPCHRVLACNGLGGFGPGPDIKRRLLQHEGIPCG